MNLHVLLFNRSFLKPSLASLPLLIGAVLAPAPQARADQIGIASTNTGVVLTWTNPAAVLEGSFKLPGFWNQITGAVSPWLIRTTNAANFFRLRLSSLPAATQYRINSSGGPNGAITPAASLLVAQGTNLAYGATPDAGYIVDLWYRDGVAVQTNGGTFSLSNIQNNAEVFVTFRSPGTNPPPDTNTLISPAGPLPGPSGSSPPGPTIGTTDGNLIERYGPAVGCGCASGCELNLDCSFTYNSAMADGSWGQLDAGLGFGWTHSFNIFLSSQHGQLFRYGPDGRVTKFAAQTNGATYLPPPGYFENIVSNGPGSFTLTTKTGTTFAFTNVPGTPFTVGDAVYRLSRIADLNQNATTLAYTSGRLAAVTDTYGRVLTFSNNPSGHVGRITDPLGRSTSLGYDASGSQLISIDDPKSNTVHYAYNPRHQLSQRVDQDGRVFAFIYQRGKPIAISDPNAKNIFTLSNPSNWATDPVALTNDLVNIYIPSTTTKTDGAGNLWAYDYDTNAAITRMVAPDGATTTYTYDSLTRQISSVTDPNLHLTQYQYDSLGNLTNVTDSLTNVTSYACEPVFSQVTNMVDPNGRVTVYQYDARGNCTNIIDPLGQTVEYTYDTNGHVLTVRDKRGFITGYLYDSQGNRTNITDALGNISSMAYDGVGKVTNHVDANGSATSYTYDGLDRLIREIDPLGGVTTYSYDGSGNLTNVVDPNTNSTVFVYDQRQRLVQMIDSLNQTNSFAYDDNDNRTSSIDANGHSTSFAYDSQNRLIATLDALTNVTASIYDPSGNVRTNIDARGFQTVFVYDALDRLIQRTDPATNSLGVPCVTTNEYAMSGGAPCCSPTIGSSLLTKRTDPEGKVIYYKYDALDRLKAEIRKQGDTSDTITTNDAATFYAYDANDNVTFVTNAVGNVITRQYDPLDRQTNAVNAAGDVASATYDPVGNVITVTDSNGNITTNIYDARDRLTSTADALGPVVAYTYDNVGNRLTQTDGNGNTTTNGYDALDRLTTIVDPLGHATQYLYDPAGNLTNTVDRNGNTTVVVYDAVDRPIRSIDSLQRTNLVLYDRADNITSFTDANQHITQFQYDGLNRRISEIYPDGKPARTFVYDGVSAILRRTNQTGVVTFYGYDDLHRLTNRAYSDGGPADVFTYDLSGRMLTATRSNWVDTFAYDGADRLTNSTQNGSTVRSAYNIPARFRILTYPGGRAVTNATDFRNRISRLDDSGSPTPIVQYSYDAANRVLSRASRNGAVATPAYNPLDWVTNITHVHGTNLVTGFAYAYDNEGNKLLERNLQTANRSEAYAYDPGYRLTNYAVGLLTGVVIPSPVASNRYVLDPAGNWTTFVRNGVSQTRTHNAANQLTQIGGTPAFFDANGNQTNDGVFIYAYDEEDRLTTVTRSADMTVVGQYQYDALGRRVVKITNPAGTTNETDFYYDDARIIEEKTSGGATLATYVHGNAMDDVLTMTRLGDTYYFYQNALGSVVAATSNDTATVAERYTYDAYGQPQITDDTGAVVRTNSWGTPFSAITNDNLFTGQQLDEESGLYSYRARHYDPIKGRFLQRDPLGGWYDQLNLGNPYLYVGDSPMNYTDWSGHEGCSGFPFPGFVPGRNNGGVRGPIPGVPRPGFQLPRPGGGVRPAPGGRRPNLPLPRPGGGGSHSPHAQPHPRHVPPPGAQQAFDPQCDKCGEYVLKTVGEKALDKLGAYSKRTKKLADKAKKYAEKGNKFANKLAGIEEEEDPLVRKLMDKACTHLPPNVACTAYEVGKLAEKCLKCATYKVATAVAPNTMNRLMNGFDGADAWNAAPGTLAAKFGAINTMLGEVANGIPPTGAEAPWSISR